MDYTTDIKIRKVSADAVTPSYAHVGDAGIDMYSCENTCVRAGERAIVATGICFELEPGYVALVWDKSGVAAKSGIKSMAGVIDSGYRGEIKIVLFNTSKVDYVINKGDKIAQILIQKIEYANLVEDKELTNSERGDKGFGSTGLR